MNEIQIFNNPEFGEIRTITIDGEPWFVARDLADILGYQQTNNMRRVIDDDDKRLIDPQNADFSGFRQNGVPLESNKSIHSLTIINESGLYSAIFGSTLPNAKKFKRWVTAEVLPSIRKTGSYNLNLPTTTAGQIQLLAKGHVELEKKIDAVREDMQETKNDFEEFKQNCPCFPVELTAISDEVKKKGVSVMGGKSSNAYHDRSITQSVYRDIYSEIHRNFGCDTYKAIPRKHVPKVLELVKQYTLPIILQERIAQANT